MQSFSLSNLTSRRVLPEFRDKISICNYRFIKEFTKGVDSDWTVNVVNHFKPSDYVEE